MTDGHDHAGLEYVLARMIQDFMQFMQETGLSRPQIHALLHIYHAGECPVSEIGDLSDASPAAASPNHHTGGSHQEQHWNSRIPARLPPMLIM